MMYVHTMMMAERIAVHASDVTGDIQVWLYATPDELTHESSIHIPIHLAKQLRNRLNELLPQEKGDERPADGQAAGRTTAAAGVS
jgi:hypothetical protein